MDDYDEFGNYIGADLDSDDEDELPEDRFIPQQQTAAPLEGYDDDDPMQGTDENALMQIDGALYSLIKGLVGLSNVHISLEPQHNAVILHEDKQYYPSAQDVYGADVETMVQEEDTQPLSEPIIAPVKVRKWQVEEKDMPETRFDKG